MTLLKPFLLLVCPLVAYVIIMNAIVTIPPFFLEESVTTSTGGGFFHEEIGFSDKVAVSVVKNRWYGQIHEQSFTNSKVANLYLFNVVKLPLENKNFNFRIAHYFSLGGFFLFFWMMFLAYLFTKNERRR